MLRCRSTAGDPLKPQRLGLLEVDGNLRRDAPSPRTIIRAIKQGPDRQSRSRSLYPPHRRSGPCPGKSVLQLFGWGSPVSQSGVLGGSERQTQRRQPPPRPSLQCSPQLPSGLGLVIDAQHFVSRSVRDAMRIRHDAHRPGFWTRQIFFPRTRRGGWVVRVFKVGQPALRRGEPGRSSVFRFLSLFLLCC